MIIPFIKYVKPIWYYNLNQYSGEQCYWLDYNKLTHEEKSNLIVDQKYTSEAAKLRDLAYQAWNVGITNSIQTNMLDRHTLQENLHLKDNYRFIRKYYKSIWSLYILILRLITLHNPVKEIRAYYSTRDVKRVLFDPKGLYGDYKNYNSTLVNTIQPKVSVVIPTLNRYKYLYDVMRDLESQTYNNFEVIIVDQSDPFDKGFYEQFNLDLNLIYQSDKALWKARNHAVRVSKGDYILLFDDDSRIEPDWISQNLKCLDYFDADVSAGVSISVVGGKVPTNYSYFRWADQLDTGNALLKKRIFNHIGLFDQQFEKQRMGDGEFGLRLYLNGYKSISNPYAKRLHLKVSSGGLRQMGSWDGFRPKSYFSPRPIPSVLYYFRRYYGNYLTMLSLIIYIPQSLLPYKYKGNQLFLNITRIVSVFLLPLVGIQVLRSWVASSKKIKQGSKIESI